MYWGRHLVKMLRAVDFLARPGGASMEELGEVLGVDRRTAYRIRETLEELNFPLYEDTSSMDGRKRYRFEESYLKKLPNLDLPALNLTLSEIIALYFIRGNKQIFNGTDIELDIKSAFSKLDAFVPDGLLNRLDKVRTLFVPSTKFSKDYRDKEGIIESLTEAIFRQQTCLVQYHSFHDDRQKSFEIDPLCFVERDGGLYVFVRTTLFGSIRLLAVERVVTLAATDKSFVEPEHFDPDALLEGTFGLIFDDSVNYRILFSAEKARYVEERCWSSDQEIIHRDDGSIELIISTAGWFDVKR
jgi:predicted DNA-binding transcriptional regulator YafY